MYDLCNEDISDLHVYFLLQTRTRHYLIRQCHLFISSTLYTKLWKNNLSFRTGCGLSDPRDKNSFSSKSRAVLFSEAVEVKLSSFTTTAFDLIDPSSLQTNEYLLWPSYYFFLSSIFLWEYVSSGLSDS